jgi:hypothetical protein
MIPISVKIKIQPGFLPGSKGVVGEKEGGGKSGEK